MKRRLALVILLSTITLSGCRHQLFPPATQPTTGLQPIAGSSAPTAAPVLPTTLPTTAPTAAITAVPAPTTSTPIAPVTDAQPATDPLDTAQRFLAALQGDRSGRLAANYAGGVLAEQLRSGAQDVGWLLGEQNPFTGYTVDYIVAETPPFAYVQVSLFYGEPPQPVAARTLTLQQEGGFWRVIEIVLPEGEIVPTAVPSPEQQARNAAAEFVALLSGGRYQEAAARFGGDLAAVQAQHPDISGDWMSDPELRGRLLERYCAGSGGACLGQRRIVHTELVADGPMLVWVEFNRPDGGLYLEAAQPLQVQGSNGTWLVLDLPPALR